MAEPLLKAKARVIDVRKQVIPRMYAVTAETEDGTVFEFDSHEDLVTYKVGDELNIELSRDIPEYRDGIDFVGRGTVASIREEDNRLSVLISIGGLLFIVRTAPGKLQLKPTEKVYVKIAKLTPAQGST